jgi:hypothetical protein
MKNSKEMSTGTEIALRKRTAKEVRSAQLQ